MIKFSEKAQRGLERFQLMRKSAAPVSPVTEINALNFNPQPSVDGSESSAQISVTSPGSELSQTAPEGGFNSSSPATSSNPSKEEKPWLNERAKSYLGYAGASAGMGALIGSLIQLVRGKNIFSGALVGAGIGGGLGAAHRYGLEASEDYAKDNSLEKHLFQPMWDKIDSWSSGTNA